MLRFPAVIDYEQHFAASHRVLEHELSVIIQHVFWYCTGRKLKVQARLATPKIGILAKTDPQNCFKLFAADVLISRAGASSISELALVGKPVLLIPSPNVAENHQYHNALALSKTGGALVLLEKVIDSQLQEALHQLLAINKDDVQERFKRFARPNATQDIVLKIKNELKS